MAKKVKKSKRTNRSPRRNPLPLYLGGGALVIIIIGVVLLWRPSSPAQFTGGPRLAVDQEQIDFGPVKLGKTVKADFKLTNVGDQPLQILGEPVVELRAGC